MKRILFLCALSIMMGGLASAQQLQIHANAQQLQIKSNDGTLRYHFSAVDGDGAELSLYNSVGEQRTRIAANTHTFFNLGGGYVGIGTTNPTSRFQINTQQGSIRYAFSAEDGYGAELSLYDAGGNQRTRISASSHTFFNTSGGNVGIGMQDPAHPLHMASTAHVTAGGVWTNASDRNRKENLTLVDGEMLLERLKQLPIFSWNYMAEEEHIKHIGPNAQDFYALFGVGNSDKTISTIDPAGISLAIIQVLSRQNQQLAAQNEELATRLATLEAIVESLLEQRKHRE